MCFERSRYMNIIKNKYLNYCIKELDVEICCRMLCCEEFSSSFCVLLPLAEGDLWCVQRCYWVELLWRCTDTGKYSVLLGSTRNYTVQSVQQTTKYETKVSPSAGKTAQPLSRHERQMKASQNCPSLWATYKEAAIGIPLQHVFLVVICEHRNELKGGAFPCLEV
jgi:hypothetical protein